MNLSEAYSFIVCKALKKYDWGIPEIDCLDCTLVDTSNCVKIRNDKKKELKNA